MVHGPHPRATGLATEVLRTRASIGNPLIAADHLFPISAHTRSPSLTARATSLLGCRTRLVGYACLLTDGAAADVDCSHTGVQDTTVEYGRRPLPDFPRLHTEDFLQIAHRGDQATLDDLPMLSDVP